MQFVIFHTDSNTWIEILIDTYFPSDSEHIYLKHCVVFAYNVTQSSAYKFFNDIHII